MKQQDTPLAARLKARADTFMSTRLRLSSTTRVLVFHYLRMLYEQLQAMLPITLLQVLVLAIFFRKTTPTPGLEAAGLIAAVIGLVLFLEGLRVAVMPLAMLVGEQLPQRLALPLVLLVAFCLGVLVTYAEPAIAAIRPLASLVDPSSAPYLYFIMNQHQEVMVLAIGIGVGVAAVIGTLKYLYGISLKPLIAAALLPTIGLACYMQWGHEHLQPLLGVAWDCGAVTTGPVTVPVLLSLGVGVMDAQRQKRAAQEMLKDAALKKSEGNTLEGFGIVTLASLLPILAVELMAVIIGATYPYDLVLQQARSAAAHAATAEVPLVESSPVKEVVYAIRAIAPLLVALVLLVVVVLRQPLPSKGFTHFEEASSEHGGCSTDTVIVDTAGRADAAAAGDGGLMDAAGSTAACDVEQGHDQAVQNRREQLRSALSFSSFTRTPSFSRPPSVVAKAVILTAGDKWAEDYFNLQALSDQSSDTGDSAPPSSSSQEALHDGAGAPHKPGCLAVLRKHSALLVAMLMCQTGMVLFNLGLTYGFSALGDMTGVTLPAAFIAVADDPSSPYYSYAGGVTLTMVTIFLLGILATKAEPALNVLGETVETLSGGKLTKMALIYAVCVGVAVGMCAGACKILFQLPLIWFILVKYMAAGALTVAARESITAVAWDSAGVTTGPVTVPFVLSIGIGFAKAVGAPEGFGMLTVMSVAPIISVLLTSLLKQPVKSAATTLVQASKVPLQKLSRPLQAAASSGQEAGNTGAPQMAPITEAQSFVASPSGAAGPAPARQ